MTKALIVAAATAGVLAIAAPATTASPTTTSPGYNFTITVSINEQGAVLSRSVAKRGWRAHFVITNKGTKAHIFDVGGLKTAPIAPGQKRKLGAFLDDRGRFAYKIDRKIRGYFTVI
jgi:hypothetical protein